MKTAIERLGLAAGLAMLLTAYLLTAAVPALAASSLRPFSRNVLPSTLYDPLSPRTAQRFLGPPLPSLPRVPSGTGVITGTVKDFSGSLLPGALLQVPWPDGSVSSATTDGGGLYTLSGVPAVSGTGALFMTPPVDDYMLGREELTWADPGPTTFDFQPGRMSVVLTRSGPWKGWTRCDVQLYGHGADPYVTAVYADQGIRRSAADTSLVVHGVANLLPGAYDAATVNFWANEGLEVILDPGAAQVTEGALSGATLVANEKDALWAAMTSRWASGSPGKNVILALGNFPESGVWGRARGYSEYEHRAVREYGQFGVYPSDWPGGLVPKTLRVATTAPVGYQYYLGLQHEEGPLYLEVAYQVCTLKPSQAAISRGSAIRLSGTIPLAGHYGTQPATAGVKVAVFKRTTAANQPASWSSPKGWTKVATLQTDGNGNYRTGRLWPPRSTWYVVRYPGSTNAGTEQYYWKAFTSVVKVTVR